MRKENLIQITRKIRADQKKFLQEKASKKKTTESYELREAIDIYRNLEEKK